MGMDTFSGHLLLGATSNMIRHTLWCNHASHLVKSWASGRCVPTCFNRVAASRGGGALAAGCFAGGLGGCSCTSSSHSMTRHVCVACQLPHASHTRTSFAGKSPQGKVAEPSPLAALPAGWQAASPHIPGAHSTPFCDASLLPENPNPFSANGTCDADGASARLSSFGPQAMKAAGVD